jgi:hypothetical protein
MKNWFRKIIIASIAMVATWFAGRSVDASLITYGDYPSWYSHVTGIATVDISDPSPPSTFAGYGTGDQSLYFNDSTNNFYYQFSQNGSLGNARFYNIGSKASGHPAVISSQQQTYGVANIQVDFFSSVSAFSLDYGTRNGSDVTFTLINYDQNSDPMVVDTFTQSSTGNSQYAITNFARATDTSLFSAVLITTNDIALYINHVSTATVLPPSSPLNPPGPLLDPTDPSNPPNPSNITVPEPSSFVLLSVGGVGLAVGMIRRRQKLRAKTNET